MKQYIGVKLINAKPMTRLEYNEFRGWKLPANENGADEGFLVEYLDGGAPNTPDYAGYVSWSPAAVFHNAYGETTGMTFGLALEALKRGDKVARAGWNGKGMWLSKVSADSSRGLLAYIQMKTVQDQYVPWLASQTDMLANDWSIV